MHRAIFLVALVGLMDSAAMPSQAAQLLSGVSFDRQAIFHYGYTEIASDHFAGVSLPATGSGAAIAPDGEYITANYQFTDNGQTADFGIQTQKSFSGGSGNTEEGMEYVGAGANDTPALTYFTTSETTYYHLNMSSAEISFTYPPGSETFGGSSSLFDLYQIDGNQPSTWTSVLFANTDIGSPLPQSGMLAPGQYVFEQSSSDSVWTAINCTPGYYVGTTTFDFSLTTVPEPGAIGMLALCTFAVIGARCRRVIVCID